MSESTYEELVAEHDHYENVARVLEEQLSRLDRSGTDWRRTLGIELPDSRRYEDGPLGSARYCADLVRLRAEWLRGRYEELSERAARRERAHETEARGLDRFLDYGRYKLDDLLEPELQRRRARWEATGR